MGRVELPSYRAGRSRRNLGGPAPGQPGKVARFKEGKWLHWAKIAFEKHIRLKGKTGGWPRRRPRNKAGDRVEGNALEAQRYHVPADALA